jgi:putative transposase
LGDVLWRSIKYEDVYLRAYDSVSAAKAGIARDLLIAGFR